MDIQALAVEVISNGAEEYKNFGGLSALYDEYNRLDSKVDDLHLAIKELQQQVNNYEEFLIVERGRLTPSDLTIQVLADQQEVLIQTVSLMYKDLSENLIKMSLLETVVEYVISYSERNEVSEESDQTEKKDFFASSELAEVDEEDEEDYEDEYGSDAEDDYGVDSDEDYEPEEDEEEIEYINEQGVMLFSLEFNPEMPEHLKIVFSEYIQDCTKIFVDEIINLQKEKNEAAKMETETPEEDAPAYDNPYAVVFGSDFGKITGELSVSSPEAAATEDEDLEDDEDDYDPLANLALNADGTLQENDQNEDWFESAYS